MFDGKSWSVASVLAALVLSACASAASGVMSGNEPTYVDSVEVVEHDTSAPEAFAGTLREAVLAGAVFYGTMGRPITLKIDVDRVHFKNALKALTIGDDNQTKARVAVVDRPTGQQLASFVVSADGDLSGQLAAEIGIGVAGAFDPTGIVDIVGAIGSAASADINRSGTARAMRANLTAETLRQTFGDARTKAVALARKNEGRQRGPTNAPAQ
jgi:hypothetical protein